MKAQIEIDDDSPGREGFDRGFDFGFTVTNYHRMRGTTRKDVLSGIQTALGWVEQLRVEDKLTEAQVVDLNTMAETIRMLLNAERVQKLADAITTVVDHDRPAVQAASGLNDEQIDSTLEWLSFVILQAQATAAGFGTA